MNENKKNAILLVHHGTTNAEAYEKSIGVLNRRVAETFPDVELRKGYTSPKVLAALRKWGVILPRYRDALTGLQAEGYENIIVRSTQVMVSLSGKPFIRDHVDCRWLAELLAERVGREDAEMFLIGHGTDGEANEKYRWMDEECRALGFSHVHVVTLHSHPGLEETIELLRNRPVTAPNRVVLVPLLYIAGHHATKDIRDKWTERLGSLGYEVEVRMEGLGEIPEVQDRIISSIESSIRR